MAINFEGEKIKEPEDNIKYSEKKFERQKNNGIADGVDQMMVAKLNRKERNDLILLQTKEDNTDTFGPLTEKQQERLRDLLLKEKED